MSAGLQTHPKLVLTVLIGVAVSAVFGFVTAVGYLIFMRTVAGVGRSMDGLALVASVVVYPVLAAIFSLIWTAFSIWRRAKTGPPGFGKALFLGALTGLLSGLIFAGPSGFKLTGGAPAFNYALVVLGAGAALIFELLAAKMLRHASS